MKNKMHRNSVLIFLVLSAFLAANAFASGTVPAPFKGHNPDSQFTIKYGDVDTILRTMVVDVGRSTRKVAAPTQAQTGTRMKAKVSRTTSAEGNRFFFEEFKDNEEYKTLLHNVRGDLEAIPAGIPMENFTRTEQLAYWLNLYNITLLDELVQIYPERDLKKELSGKKSILAQKVMNVAGVPLSLNDIAHTILPQNYDNNPLVMYGLFQGVIGGPNIRKRAYTAANVYRYLTDNAEEFINSNRGTLIYKDSTFKVSSYYEQVQSYFPNFDTDLKAHLTSYLENPELNAARAARTFKPDIDDWTIADVYGTYQQIGGSFATSQAAMLDAVVSTQPDGQGGTVSTNFSVAGSALIAKTEPIAAMSPEQLELLTTIKNKEEAANLIREGRVTVEELGTVESESSESEQ